MEKKLSFKDVRILLLIRKYVKRLLETRNAAKSIQTVYRKHLNTKLIRQSELLSPQAMPAEDSEIEIETLEKSIRNSPFKKSAKKITKKNTKKSKKGTLKKVTRRLY